MRYVIRGLQGSLAGGVLALACLVVVPHDVAAQVSQRGQPTTAFAVSDLAKLHWLEGTWQGSSPGEPSEWERYHFLNDSTIEITYYGDSTLSRQTGTGRVYLTVGRIYHTFGSGRWGAMHVDAKGVFFVPQVNANNSFAWSFQSASAWTSTMRMAMSGREKVTVYQMRRLGGATAP